MSSTRDALVNNVLDKMFINGAGQTADRLILIQEDHNGKAKITDAQDLGGWGRLPLRDLLLAALRQRESEVRAEERERAARVVDLKVADYDDRTAHVLRAVAGAIRRDSEAREGEQSK